MLPNSVCTYSGNTASRKLLIHAAPISFLAKQVGDEKRAIKGLDEGIRGMKAGGTRRIVVPPQVNIGR